MPVKEDVVYVSLQKTSIRNIVCALLKEWTYSIVVLENGQTIHNALKTALPHLLLCDQYATDAHGTHWVEKLCADPVYRKIPMILFHELDWFPEWLWNIYSEYPGEICVCQVVIPFSAVELKNFIAIIEKGPEGRN